MIDIKDRLIHIKSKNNSYIIYINGHNDVENLYYGAKITDCNVDSLVSDRAFIVNTLYPEGDANYCIDGVNFEFSLSQRGDSRSASVIVGDQISVADFEYEKIVENASLPDADMPIPKNPDDVCSIVLKDRTREGVRLKLWYAVYESSDVIVRFTQLENNSSGAVTIRKMMSAQYDLPYKEQEVSVFEGAWGRERRMCSAAVRCGKFTLGSYSGMSSAECSPFFMVKDIGSNEYYGNVYAFNLIYSASHEASLQVTPYGGMRIMHGIQSEGFAYELKSGEVFTAPAAISTFSNCGIGKVSCNMQRFALDCIIPNKKIPIMLNTWEGMYFDVNEEKLISLSQKAKELGFDGLVIDDGWFEGRNDDSGALGDWVENRAKFPNGIKAFADRIHSMDMKLGIWIEPEMISRRSRLFEEKPQWALRSERARSIVGRNQMILDLTLPDVEQFVFNTLSRLVECYGANYIKWDFNRRFADIAGGEGSGYFYRYICALYRILKRFTSKFPDVVLENCASGGGRFDLGMLTYCPIGWVSDNTDPLSRAEIQEGTSYGFPISSMLNHISASPSHQTRRRSDFSSRRDTAFIGRLGVQYDILNLSASESILLKDAIKDYKEKVEKIISDGILYRLCEDKDLRVWEVVNGEGEGLIYIMNERFYTVSALPKIRLVALNPNETYEIYGEKIKIRAKGDTLMNAGLNLPMNNQGYGDSILDLRDISTLLLYIHKGGKV